MKFRRVFIEITMYEPKTISQAIKPILLLNLLFGLAVFEVFECWRKKPHQMFEYVYTVFYLSLLYGMNKWSVPYLNDYIIISTIPLCDSIYKAIFVFNGLLVCMLVIFGRINAKKLQTAITLIEDCDQTMENMGMTKQYQTMYKKQLKIFSTCGFFILIFCVSIYQGHFKPGSTILLKLILTSVVQAPLVLISICDISFCFWINIYLRTKFKQLNEFLRSMLTTTSDSLRSKNVLAPRHDIENKSHGALKNMQVRGNNRNAKTMRAVKQLHLELARIANILNSAYGMQILLLMTTSFIFVTGLLYLSYRLIWLDLTTKVFIREISTTIGWIITYSSKLFYISQVCVKTSAEASIAGDIICELYEPSTSREFRAEIRDFTLQLIQNPVVFTACGFFDLNHAYLQRGIGTIITYLVILIQVGDMTTTHIANSMSNKTENLTVGSFPVSIL